MGCLRITTMSSLPLLCLTIWLPAGSGFSFLQWGPDLEGPWCSRRHRGSDCCFGRNDNCAVPILGTECYCDIFCNATAYDCCPDYWVHCHGVMRAPPTTTLPPPRTTRPIEVIQACVREGRGYRPGYRIKDNCNECTCELIPAQRRYGWRCSDNVCLVRRDLIEAVNDGPYTWQATNYSFLWGMSLDDGIRYRLGTYPLEQDVLKMTPLRVRQEEVLPESFDARQVWPGFLQPVSDQGNCASSWAFSTTAVAADRLAIESEGSIVEVLSPQHMLSCDTSRQDGCTGGYVDRAWWYLRRHGVVTEACYPYRSGVTGVQGECEIALRQRGGDCPSGIQYKSEKRFKASPPYRIRPLEREIMKEIMDNGPVQAIFEVKEDFYTYKSGVYQYTDLTRRDPPAARKSGFHSVRIIGWGVERTPSGEIVKYWICANSWGTDWGENGYFRILRGVQHSQIENFIVGAWGRITGDVLQRQLLERNIRRRLQGPRDVRRLRELTPRGKRRRQGPDSAAELPDNWTNSTSRQKPQKKGVRRGKKAKSKKDKERNGKNQQQKSKRKKSKKTLLPLVADL